MPARWTAGPHLTPDPPPGLHWLRPASLPPGGALVSEKLFTERWRACGRTRPRLPGLGTHVTELVPGGAEPGAGGFAEALVLAVAVAPSGQDSLHLGTERGLSKQPEPLRACWGGGGAAPPEGAAQGGQVLHVAQLSGAQTGRTHKAQGQESAAGSVPSPVVATPLPYTQQGGNYLPLSSDPPQSQAGIRLQGWVWTATGCVTQGHHSASLCLSCCLRQLLLFTQKPPWTPHAPLTGGAEIRGV